MLAVFVPDWNGSGHAGRDSSVIPSDRNTRESNRFGGANLTARREKSGSLSSKLCHTAIFRIVDPARSGLPQRCPQFDCAGNAGIDAKVRVSGLGMARLAGLLRYCSPALRLARRRVSLEKVAQWLS